jgi:hypothetical protein
VNLLQAREVFTPDLALLASEIELLNQFDVDAIATEALLFQTGYLTIKRVQNPLPGAYIYELTYPNLEVEISLNKALLPALGIAISRITPARIAVLQAFSQRDFPALKTHFAALLASIPHNWHRKNNIRNYEGHYASVFYSHFAALGLQVQVEHAVATGQIDMVVIFKNSVFIFEFKVVKTQAAGAAIAQIKSNNYAEKYHALGCAIYLIGIEFSRAKKNIVGFDVEQAH